MWINSRKMRSKRMGEWIFFKFPQIGSFLVVKKYENQLIKIKFKINLSNQMKWGQWSNFSEGAEMFLFEKSKMNLAIWQRCTHKTSSLFHQWFFEETNFANAIFFWNSARVECRKVDGTKIKWKICNKKKLNEISDGNEMKDPPPLNQKERQHKTE